MKPPGFSARVVRYGAFEVDLVAGELRKDGLRLQLQEQPFQVLAALLEQPGEVVAREDLIRRLWPHGTHVDFDRGLNAAVTRLRQALSDSAETPRYVETVARRGYRFIGPLGSAAPPAPAPPLPSRWPMQKFAVAAGIAFLMVGAAGALWFARGRDQAAVSVIPLTTTPGIEREPSLSPDGSMVAFSWDGEKEGGRDIYVKMIGSATSLRLTSDAADNTFPSWSPDGRQIAFLRRSGSSTAICLVSPLGGPERKLLDFDAAPEPPSWSPDGKWLMMSRIYSEPPTGSDAGAVFLLPLSGGAPRAVLSPKPGHWLRFPTLSPNGRELAFASCEGSISGPTCHLFVTRLNTPFEPQRTARQLTSDAIYFTGLAWTPDERFLICGTSSTTGASLWKVSTASGRKPERLEFASQGATTPSVSLRGNRLAFSRTHYDENLWRLEASGKSEPVLVSTMLDRSPQYSPDGRRIAFASARSGDRVAVWLAQADGSGATQVTAGPEIHQGSPRWSPDGRWIAFDARASDGTWNIKVVESGGGQPRQLTSGSSSNICPSWSHDGKWVYFGSDRSGRFEIWRTPVSGGAAEQLTREGGVVALESADGSTIYYTRASLEGPLFTRRIVGGKETQLLERVTGRAFSVFPDGVYYAINTGSASSELRLLEFAAGMSGSSAHSTREWASALRSRRTGRRSWSR